MSNKKYILGFQINGIGNGHLTQAKTVYDVIIKKYQIPVVIFYGKNNNNIANYFSKSKVVFKKMYSTPESTNDFKMSAFLRDTFSIKQTKPFEKQFGINKWFNFFVADLFNFKTKQINIAHQWAIQHKIPFIAAKIGKTFNNINFVSIYKPCLTDKYTIPPLIDLKKVDRRNIKKKYILAYSVSGQDFPTRLIKLAEKYFNYNFYYFTKTIIKKKIPKNIFLFKPDKDKFQEYFKICGAILCTTGNELIMECIYNKIPVATMPASNKHQEQKINFKKYVIDLTRFAFKMTL